ncbi:MAG TPA: acyltransferase family protein, partial [Thermoanaerobaculia bacterium]
MTDTPRLLTLEAVRGLAALCVVVVHVALETGNYHIIPVGFVALDVFFVMSGFVNSRAYDDKLLAGMSWKRFMLLRVVRFYPSMFLGILVGLVAYAVIPASAYPIGLIQGGDYQLSWKTLGHFVLLPDLTAREGIFPLNGVLWSLFFEMVVIGVHGLTVRYLTIRRLSVFVVAIAVAWAFTALTAGQWGWGAGWNGPSFLRGFLRIGWAYGAGVLLRRATAYGWRVPALVPVALTVLVLFLPDFGLLRPRTILSVFVLAPLIVALAAGAE